MTKRSPLLRLERPVQVPEFDRVVLGRREHHRFGRVEEHMTHAVEVRAQRVLGGPHATCALSGLSITINIQHHRATVYNVLYIAYEYEQTASLQPAICIYN